MPLPSHFRLGSGISRGGRRVEVVAEVSEHAEVQ